MHAYFPMSTISAPASALSTVFPKQHTQCSMDTTHNTFDFINKFVRINLLRNSRLYRSAIAVVVAVQMHTACIDFVTSTVAAKHSIFCFVFGCRCRMPTTTMTTTNSVQTKCDRCVLLLLYFFFCLHLFFVVVFVTRCTAGEAKQPKEKKTKLLHEHMAVCREPIATSSPI